MVCSFGWHCSRCLSSTLTFLHSQHKNNVSAVLVAIVLVLSLPPADATKYAARIPNPNVCSTKQAVKIKTGTWLSHDCPITALCIPPLSGSSNISWCSCKFSEEMFVDDHPTGLCVPSTASYVFAGYWIVIAAALAMLSAYMGRSLVLAYQFRILRFDPLTSSCVLAFVASVVNFVSRVLRIMLLVDVFNPVQYEFWLSVEVTVVSIYSLCIIATIITFGLAVHIVIIRSSNLRAINGKKLLRRVSIASVFMGALIVFGSILFLEYGQYALAFAYSAIFCLLSWCLYFRIVKQSTFMDDNDEDSKSFNNTANTKTNSNIGSGNRTLNSRSRSHGSGKASTLSSSEGIIKNMIRLSIRVFVLLVAYILVAVLYNITWYLGRMHESYKLLGYGVAVAVGAQFFVTTIGLFFVASFTQTLFHIRSAAKVSLSSTKRGLKFDGNSTATNNNTNQSLTNNNDNSSVAFGLSLLTEKAQKSGIVPAPVIYSTEMDRSCSGKATSKQPGQPEKKHQYHVPSPGPRAVFNHPSDNDNDNDNGKDSNNNGDSKIANLSDDNTTFDDISQLVRAGEEYNTQDATQQLEQKNQIQSRRDHILLIAE